ncbi:unnamed protein product, partial [Coregonus sp. 'balchen']
MLIYFPERVLNSGNLLCGDLGNIAQVYPVKQSNTNLVNRFKNRLHWNNVTGFFTLSDLQIDDSGVYTPQVTVHDNSSCSVVCSVENGRDVTLSWYRGGKLLNRRSSPDLNISLSLPLKVDEQNGDSYRCEAANPVSKETTVTNVCIESDPSKVTDSPERKQDDIHYAEITHIKPADNQEERTSIQGLEARRDNPNLTLVYDTLQLHRMAASEDVNTA